MKKNYTRIKLNKSQYHDFILIPNKPNLTLMDAIYEIQTFKVPNAIILLKTNSVFDDSELKQVAYYVDDLLDVSDFTDYPIEKVSDEVKEILDNLK